MPSPEERFQDKVITRDGHDIWTGSTDHRGAGMVRINGKLRTVQRAAWAFAHGPLPLDARVNSCATQRACVRLDHLSLARTPTPPPSPAPRQRRPKGTGSIRAVRPGVWEVVTSHGKTDDGRPRRRSLTIHGTRHDAETAAAALAATARHDLGDLRVRELIGRHLEQRTHGTSLERDKRILHDIIEPALGDILAAELEPSSVDHHLRGIYRAVGTADTKLALSVLRSAYQWAMRQGWCKEDPTTDMTIRSIM